MTKTDIVKSFLRLIFENEEVINENTESTENGVSQNNFEDNFTISQEEIKEETAKSILIEEDDEKFEYNEKLNLNGRDFNYNSILNDYTKYITSNLNFKTKQQTFLKWILISAVIVSFVLIICLTIYFVYNISAFDKVGIDGIIAYLSSLIPLSIAFFKSLNVLIEFVYNPNEMEQIVQIIKNIQNHDMSMRELHNKREERRNLQNTKN